MPVAAIRRSHVAYASALLLGSGVLAQDPNCPKDAPQIALIGAGVSAASFIFHLRDQLSNKAACVTLFEKSASPGGRASTFYLEGQGVPPQFYVDHGAPEFYAATEPFKNLCEFMVKEGALEQVPESTEVAFVGLLAENGGPEPRDHPTFLAVDGVQRLTEALFHRGDATMMKQSPLIGYESLHFKTLVTQIDQYEVDGKVQWRITDDDNIKYAPFDWLVVSSAELASPYSPDSALFGQMPPLARAAETINNADLNDAITGIAGGKPDGVISLIYAFQGDVALAYQRLPCTKCRLDDHGSGKGVLEYMVIQKRKVPEDMAALTFVVFQSTKEFAADHMVSCEQDCIDELTAGISLHLGPWFADGLPGVDNAAWGPIPFNWDNAYPGTQCLPPALQTINEAKITFVGDYIQHPRMGSVEGAFISGLAGAFDVVQALDLPEGKDDNEKPQPGMIQPDVQSRRQLERQLVQGVLDYRRELSASGAACPIHAHTNWFETEEGRAWEFEWKSKFDAWWIATPYKDGLGACFGALGLHMAQRWQQFLSMITGKPTNQMPPTTGGQHAADAKCDFLTDGSLELPDFPALPKNFDKFEVPSVLPIPRLLPNLQHLQSLAPADAGLTASGESSEETSGVLAMGAGFGVGLGIAAAAGLVWHFAVPARVRSARPSIRRAAAVAEDKPPAVMSS